MKHFNKYLLLFIFTFLIKANFTFAAEVQGFSNTLPGIVGDIFRYATIASGSLALISFTIGALQYTISQAGGSSNDAKDRMKGAVLGLILTASSWLILNTINPELTKPKLGKIDQTNGVFYACANLGGAPLQESYTAGVGGVGCDQIKYECSNGILPPYFVWIYSEPNFKGDVSVGVLRCGSSSSVGASYKMAAVSPGIYYCLGFCSSAGDCSGNMSGPNLTSGKIEEPFKNHVESVLIVSGENKFGAVFHGADDNTRGGLCNMPIYSSGNMDCIGGISVSTSVDIFKWNNSDPTSSGNGIEFYGETFGWNSSQNAGKCFIKQVSSQEDATATCDNISPINDRFVKPTKDLVFDYTNVERTQEYKNLYKTFQQHPGSIRIKGNYLVAIYSTGAGACGNGRPFKFCTDGTQACTCSGSDGPCGNGQLMQTCPNGTESCNCPSTGTGTCQTTNPNQPGYCAGGGTCVAGACTNGGSTGSSGNSLYCQTFTKDVPNMNEMEFVAKKNIIDSVHIIPIK